MQSTQSTPDANNTIAPSAHDFEVFSGEATTAEARVYVRLNAIGGGKSNLAAQIAGQLIGPFCEFSQTLPAQHRFLEIDQREHDQKTALAQAIAADPCFWTPELPFLYRVQLQLRFGEVVSEVTRTIGIRRLGVRGKSLFFDGKRFVLRGWHECRMQNEECIMLLERNQVFLRHTWTAMIVANPDDDVCEFASRRGILLVADLTDESNTPIASLRRVSRWPAVGFATLPRSAAISAGQIAEIPNLLLAQFVQTDQPISIAPWANLLLVETKQPELFANKIVGVDLPVVAVRPSANINNIEQARAECDILQSDLAPFGDFAGYVV
jgi:Glycosyl hydrolases family 2